MESCGVCYEDIQHSVKCPQCVYELCYDCWSQVDKCPFCRISFIKDDVYHQVKFVYDTVVSVIRSLSYLSSEEKGRILSSVGWFLINKLDTNLRDHLQLVTRLLLESLQHYQTHVPHYDVIVDILNLYVDEIQL